MRFFKNCKVKNSVAVAGSTSRENSKNDLTDLSADVFFTINGKPYQGRYLLYSLVYFLLIHLGREATLLHHVKFKLKSI